MIPFFVKFHFFFKSQPVRICCFDNILARNLNFKFSYNLAAIIFHDFVKLKGLFTFDKRFERYLADSNSILTIVTSSNRSIVVKQNYN